MSDTQQVREDSELHTERGTTTVSGTIVSQIAEIATGRMEGIRVGNITTNVGQHEAALDFNMGMEFGRDLKELTSEIRSRISSQVEGMTGLKVKEQNIIVTDVFFPEAEDQDGKAGEEEIRREIDGESDDTDRETDRETEREADPETEQETDRGTNREADEADRRVLLDTEKEDDEEDRDNEPRSR